MASTVGMTVEGPYFSIEGNDVAMYDDLPDVEAHLEAIDVCENGLDTIFASNGTILRLSTVGGKWGKVVATDEVAGHDPTRLAEALRAYLLAEPPRKPLGRRRKREVDRDAIREAPLPMLVAEFQRTERAYP